MRIANVSVDFKTNLTVRIKYLASDIQEVDGVPSKESLWLTITATPSPHFFVSVTSKRFI
jgi:hypothetical protein